VAERRTGVLLQMIQQNDDKHEAGHHRLRTDWRTLEQRVASLEMASRAAELRVSKIENTPAEITKIQWTWRPVITVGMICFGLGAGQFWLNSRLEGNVKALIDQNSKTQDERYVSMQKTIDSLKNRVELSQIELTSFKENLLRDLGLRRVR
jgi:hypothetical protein